MGSTNGFLEHKKSMSESGLGTNQNKVPNNFLSTTKRDDFWKNKIDAPFTKATNEGNPGPGKYNLNKKKDDIKTKIL